MPCRPPIPDPRPPTPMSELPIEIDVHTVKQMQDRGEKFVLLDCREAAEVATASCRPPARAMTDELRAKPNKQAGGWKLVARSPERTL